MAHNEKIAHNENNAQYNGNKLNRNDMMNHNIIKPELRQPWGSIIFANIIYTYYNTHSCLINTFLDVSMNLDTIEDRGTGAA